jgi:hypothetical protein
MTQITFWSNLFFGYFFIVSDFIVVFCAFLILVLILASILERFLKEY